MEETALISFWIKSPFQHAPIGFGVTANSLDDALDIIRALDYRRYLPDDLAGVEITEHVNLSSLEPLSPIGPVAVRGMWYPFTNVGVPRWAEERIADYRRKGARLA